MVNRKVWFQYFSITLVALGFMMGISQAPGLAEEYGQASGRFECGTDPNSGHPATIASNGAGRGDVVLIIWQTRTFGTQWSPERRCEVVSERFQQNNENGTLQYIISGELRGYPVLCAANSTQADCSDSTLLITLEPGSDSEEALERLASLNRGVATPPLVSNGVLITRGNEIIGISVEPWITYLRGEQGEDECLFWGCE